MLTRNCLSLLLCVLFDGGLLTPLHPQPQQTLEPEARENVPVPGRRSFAQRVKRGWVWNQFFVLEEYMGSEPQYVGKLHSDLDKGVGTVKYTLSGDGAGTVFTIDETTGDIHAIRSLDREEKPFYTLRAQAVDVDTKKPLEPESEFIIKVQDINDNEPKFPDGPYVASVPEMSPVGAYVLQVKATDADDPTYGNSARVVYSILQGQPYFSIDPKTGVIRTALPNMDREVKEQYQVLIQAKDMGGQLGGLAGTTTVNITLTDVNDNPPRFPKSIFHLKVPESSHVGSAIGRIRAVDPDFGKNAEIEYNIVPGDGGNLFDISTDENTQEGVIKLKKPLDFETKKAYTFKVEASNLHLDHRFHSVGPFKDTATVKINVLDMDEPPVFSKPMYTMEVYEDTPVGTIIGAVTAQDLDAGSSSVRYFIDWKNDVDSYFTIDATEGTIATNELLDRESTAQYNFSIIASKVNNTAGIETRRNGYSRRQQELYFLPIVIEDSSYPVQSSTNTLTIRVCRCDSDGTIQSCNVEAIFLPVGLSTGALIAILLCIVILLVIVVLYVALRRQKKKDTLMTSKEDIRDNVIHYDDEGGGEEDTQAFDIGALRNPKVIEDNKIRRDIKPDTLRFSRHRPLVEDNTDIRDFINQRLQENDVDPTAPPYDSLATYAYEGNGSVAESLSSIDSLTTEADQDYDYLSDWGPRFKILADMFGEEESYNTDKVT
ncbi:cadherin-12 isoform X2 [Neopsephotus bourkii]|uniref:cadherin-12 isoform X2 n=1 Tax=Neopsephotus bourkii TaxID=309878 RepID=UPI002AA549B1|nr:cadherin-12 isoform X2 [Neopsephotus bourkii]